MSRLVSTRGNRMEYRHLPPADEGTEYAQRVVGSEVYVTTGLFPLGSESHKGEQLIRCPTLVLDFDLADWLQVSKSDLYRMDRDEVDTHLVDLLETIELVVEQVAGVEPSAVVMSGYGFHVYLWTACGGHDPDHAKAVNRWLAHKINETVGFAMADINATDAGTRILRPPGTFNRKGSEPVPVLLISTDGPVYELPSTVGTVREERTRQTSSAFSGIGNANGIQRVPYSDVQLLDHWSNTYQTLRELVDAELGHDDHRIRLQCPFHEGSSTDSAFLKRNNEGQAYLVCTSAQDGQTYWDDEWIPPRQQRDVVQQLTLTAQGGFRNNLQNAVTVLTLDTRWADRLWYNERTFCEMLDDRQLRDSDVINARIWIGEHYGFEPGKNMMFDAFASAVYANKRNPLIEWLDSLEWDGIERAGTWMEKAFDCEPSHYYQNIAKKFLISACARAYSPGCKVDTVLLLIGAQGLGKSTLLRTLAGGEWFGDTDLPLQNKDSFMMLARAWIYEVAELTSFRRSDAEKVKAFITSQVDNFRMPFERKAMDYPRHTCIVATSNEDTPLTDPTGSRRFWPVRLQQHVNLEWIKKNRAQLWAEARDAYLAGEPWHLDRAMEQEQKRIAEERFTEEDPLMGVLANWLERPGYETFTMTDVFQKALAGARISSNRLSKMLRQMGAAPLKRSQEDQMRMSYWIKPGIELPEGREYRDIRGAERHERTINKVIAFAPAASLD